MDYLYAVVILYPLDLSNNSVVGYYLHGFTIVSLSTIYDIIRELDYCYSLVSFSKTVDGQTVK